MREPPCSAAKTKPRECDRALPRSNCNLTSSLQQRAAHHVLVSKSSQDVPTVKAGREAEPRPTYRLGGIVVVSPVLSAPIGVPPWAVHRVVWLSPGIRPNHCAGLM